MTLTTPRELVSFLAALRRKGRGDSTLRVYHAAIARFYGAHGLSARVPRVAFRPRPSRLPAVLNRAEISAMLGLCHDPRLRLVVALAYSAGLRLSEILDLELSDIDFERRTILVRHPENRRDRIVMLSERAERYLRDYIALERPTARLLFVPGDTARRLSPDSVRRRFKTLARLASVKRDVRIHTLRHSFATHLLENGANLLHVMRLLGHANITSTLVYLHVKRDFLDDLSSPLDTLT